ncbi:MAG TPA: DUF4149 domain-containing protein [Thermoanaerobaculia bacterium]
MIESLWLGSAVFVIVAALAAFRTLSTPTDAANVVGAILTRWHYIALVAPLLLLAIEWRRSRAIVLGILFAAILLASAQAVIDTRVRAMRMESAVAISALPREHPLRRRFGLLHGVSTLLLIAQVVAAGAVVTVDEK